MPVEVEAACHVCHGTGAEPGTSPVTCPQCGGSGTVSDSHGLFALSQPCPRCRGNGVIIEKPCKNCRGSGRERVTKRYAVKIPPGAKNGTRVRLKGKGEPGRNGGPDGDLFVVIEVEPSPLYERRNNDLVLDVPVTYPEAALGATVEIPTPDGPVNLKVPAGTESGKLLRVKGRGAPKLKGGGKGDLLARVNVTVPKKLTKAEKEALESYGAGSPRAAARSGVRLMPDRPRLMISVAAELAGMHPQTLASLRGEGARPARADARRDPALLRGRHRAAAADPAADDEARAQPRGRRARAAPRGRASARAGADGAARGASCASEIRETHRQYRREVVPFKPQFPARNT